MRSGPQGPEIPFTTGTAKPRHPALATSLHGIVRKKVKFFKNKSFEKILLLEVFPVQRIYEISIINDFKPFYFGTPGKPYFAILRDSGSHVKKSFQMKSRLCLIFNNTIFSAKKKSLTVSILSIMCVNDRLFAMN